MPGAQPHEDAVTDAQWLARAAAGDHEAFGHVVRRHQAGVFRLARSLTADAHEAEDVLQQTWLAAWQGAATFRGEASVRTWLLVIARHQAYHLHARRAREPIDDTPIEDLGLAAGWGTSDPEGLAARAQRRDLVAGALRRLPALDRAVLTLRDVEGLTGEEAAAALGLGLAAMKSRLHRARLRLAAELRKGGADAAR